MTTRAHHEGHLQKLQVSTNLFWADYLCIHHYTSTIPTMVSGPPGPSMLPTKWSRDVPEKFKGHYSKIKEFIRHYEWLLAQCQITTDKEKCEGITTYCSSEVTWLIESLDEYRTPNWDVLKGRLLHLYDAEQDEAWYQLGDLDRLIHKYAKKTLRTLSDWKTYIRSSQS